MAATHLRRTLSTVEYVAFGFGSMIGVGWLVLMDDWLGRGGPAGGMLGFLLGTLALLPVARTYARLVETVPDAGAEIAYAEGVLPPFVSFGAGWTMVLAYTIVCPYEAVAIGNILARAVPAVDAWPLYEVGGRTMYAPRLAAGLIVTLLIVALNYRGIHQSGVFQKVTTGGLLVVFLGFLVLGLFQGEAANLHPAFATSGFNGSLVSTLLVLQIVPYFLVGFESIAKGSEEARDGYDARGFGRAIYTSLVGGGVFYILVIFIVAYVYPWPEIVSGRVGTEVAFERAFGSPLLAQFILFGALLSLLKVYNGNFVAATRLLYGIGKRGLVHPALGAVHRRHGTPHVAVLLLATITLALSLFGDALLVPITEVGSLACGVGWLSACAAFLLRSRQGATRPADRLFAWTGAAVSLAFILMKVVPSVPGAFTRAEWVAFGVWLGLGVAFWLARSPGDRIPTAARQRR